MTEPERKQYNHDYWNRKKFDPDIVKRKREVFNQWYENNKDDEEFRKKRKENLRRWRAKKRMKLKPKKIYRAIMAEWGEEFHQLPYEELIKMDNLEHLEYCRRWMQENPGLGNGLDYSEFIERRKVYLNERTQEKND